MLLKNVVNMYLTVISEQRILIPNKYGEKLAGVLHQTGSKKFVILCHGFRASKVLFFIISI